MRAFLSFPFFCGAGALWGAALHIVVAAHSPVAIIPFVLGILAAGMGAVLVCDDYDC